MLRNWGKLPVKHKANNSNQPKPKFELLPLPDFRLYPPLPKLAPLSEGWFIVHFFSGFKPVDIVDAIQQDLRLLPLYQQSVDSVGMVDWIAKKNRKQFENYLSPDYVLYFFSTYLPEQYEAIVSTAGGQQWLTSNFEEMKEFING